MKNVCNSSLIAGRRQVPALLLPVALLLACADHGEHAWFFELPYEERESILLRQPLDTQVDIYLYGLQHRRPPVRSLSGGLAKSGSAIIPEIVSRLDEVRSEGLQVDLLLVLGNISCRLGNLGSDHELVARVSETIGAMEDAFWREEGEKELARITGEGCGVGPSPIGP